MLKTNAGFTIMAEAYGAVPNDGDEYTGLEGVAIGRKVTDFGEEWVTWEWVEREGEERSYYWGHYFSNRETAYKDYLKRMCTILYD